jgi:hypothetical protein
LYLFALRKFIAPKIRKIPPAKIIHLLMFEDNPASLGIKVIPKLIKYKPNSKYKIKNNPPPLAIIKQEKKYI